MIFHLYCFDLNSFQTKISAMNLKSLGLASIIILLCNIAHSQFVYKIKADSLLVTNDSCNVEFNLENSTRYKTGSFLQNRWNGRTRFAYAVDSAWTLNNALYLHRGDTTFSYPLGSDSVNWTHIKGLPNNGKYIWNQDSIAQLAKAWINGQIRIDINTAGLTSGSNVSFTRSNFGSQVDSVSTTVKLTRANEYSFIFNTVYETEFNFGSSPANTLWNSDGWTNLSNIKDRTYVDLMSAVNDGSGNDIESLVVGREFIMYIVSEDRYFKVKFTSWTPADGGGGFAYTRSEVFGANSNYGLLTNGAIRSSLKSIIGGVTISRGGSDVAGNVAIGATALQNNQSGTNNIVLGENNMINNTSGANNIAIGTEALKNNTSGHQNFALGPQALMNNTSGSNNYAIGAYAMINNTTGSNNYAFGESVLESNTSGFQNAGFGMNALSSNTSGEENTAFGTYALASNNTGSYNTAIGSNALYSNYSGTYNVAIGRLTGNSYGNLNNSVILGREALNRMSNPSPLTNYTNIIAIGNQVAINNPVQSNDIYVDGLGSGNPTLSGNSSAKKIGVNLPYNQTWANNAQFQVRGSSASSGDALVIENITPATLFKVANNGQVAIGATSFAGTEKLRVTGTVLADKLKLVNIQTYADDTAAGTGGLTSGDVYKTSTGVLMIKL